MISKRSQEIILDILREEMDYAGGCKAMNRLLGENDPDYQMAVVYLADCEKARDEIEAMEASDAER